jgi:hypothetical protein
MLLELGKAISFLISLLSLYPAIWSAFFVPGTRWEERVFLGLDKIALSACICFASGLLFSWPAEAQTTEEQSLLSTPPVRLFFCALAGIIVLFLLSWYLSVYYVPLTYKYLPW